MKNVSKKLYLAINQDGRLYFIGPNPPRKWLLNYFGRKHADKMYRDTKDGRTYHTGYIIAREYLAIFEVKPWEAAG